jgi:hypothetical protein
MPKRRGVVKAGFQNGYGLRSFGLKILQYSIQKQASGFRIRNIEACPYTGMYFLTPGFGRGIQQIAEKMSLTALPGDTLKMLANGSNQAGMVV